MTTTTSRQTKVPGGHLQYPDRRNKRLRQALLIPHETFSLWLILSLGIHVTTLALWPLPPSWKVNQPSYVVVDLRPAGGPAGVATASSSEQPGITPAASHKTELPQLAVNKATTAPANPKKTIKKASKSLVIPEPKVLPSELSTSGPIPPENVKNSSEAALSTSTSTSTNVLQETIEGAQQDGTSSPGSNQAGELPGRSSQGNNEIIGTGTGEIETGQGMIRATPLGYGDNPAMPYPSTARRRGWQGKVLLRVSVSGGGHVISAQIEESSGYGILDDTAIQQVSAWRFRPASRNGVPRPDTVLVPVHFQLHSP